MQLPFHRSARFGLLLASALPAMAEVPAEADTKTRAIVARPQPDAPTGPGAVLAATPAGSVRGGGRSYQFTLTNGTVQVPVIVVGGTPYEMGFQFGQRQREAIRTFIPAVLEGFSRELRVRAEQLDEVWAATAALTDDRVEQEIVGLAHGCGLPVRLLQHAHCLPLLMPYSCSSIAAWGSATADGHLYQTRNLDWSLEAGAHEFPVVLVRLPATGHAHVTPTFSGFVGAHCGMNDAGIVLSEMGDASAKEMPYDIHAPHFTAWFRTFLYDAGSLDDVLAQFRTIPQTKRYHFVFGDGRTARRAVKVRTDARPSARASGESVRIWKDSDPTDELAPNVLGCVVYQDEGRGAYAPLSKAHGKLDGPALVGIANSIPIKGGNVLNAVFDATALRLWVSYAHGEKEAYERPSVFLDLTTLDGDKDGKPDLTEGAAAFLDR